jgi:hypothetical protein
LETGKDITTIVRAPVALGSAVPKEKKKRGKSYNWTIWRLIRDLLRTRGHEKGAARAAGEETDCRSHKHSPRGNKKLWHSYRLFGTNSL